MMEFTNIFKDYSNGLITRSEEAVLSHNNDSTPSKYYIGMEIFIAKLKNIVNWVANEYKAFDEYDRCMTCFKKWQDFLLSTHKMGLISSDIDEIADQLELIAITTRNELYEYLDLSSDKDYIQLIRDLDEQNKFKSYAENYKSFEYGFYFPKSLKNRPGTDFNNLECDIFKSLKAVGYEIKHIESVPGISNVTEYPTGIYGVIKAYSGEYGQGFIWEFNISNSKVHTRYYFIRNCSTCHAA